MKREILVEIGLRRLMATTKGLKPKNRYMSDAQKGQTCMRARRTHERPGVARRPRLTIDQQYVRSESKKKNKIIDKKQLKLGTSTKLEFLRQ